MSELYIMRWPQNFTAIYNYGATIQYHKDQSVSYANEVLSPGQTICSWSSTTNYLASGTTPSLPLLKINQTYEIGIELEADNPLPVQLQISFLDKHQVVLASYRGTQSHMTFTVPEGMISYEVQLINLRHHWLYFKTLFIGEIGAKESILKTQIDQHYEWVHTRPIRATDQKCLHVIVNKGHRSIIPVSISESADYEQIFVYTDGQEVDVLIQSLSQILRLRPKAAISLEAGLGYHQLPSAFIAKLKKDLKPIKI